MCVFLIRFVCQSFLVCVRFLIIVTFISWYCQSRKRFQAPPFLTFLLCCRALATDLHLHIIMINIYSILFVTAYKEVCFLFPFFLSFCKIEWIALRQPMFEFRLLNLQVLLFVIFLISLNLLTFNKVCLMCIVKLNFLQSFKLNNFFFC